MVKNVPIKVLEDCKEYFSKQGGRKYPCSNQIVCCGIFTKDKDKVMSFMKNKNIIEKRESKENIVWWLENGEKWIWADWNTSHRGYRFYKVAVDREVDPKIFDLLIEPYCSLYCCSFETI